MPCSSHPTKKPRFAEAARLGRRGVCYVVLAVCVYAGIQASVESFHIPSGSMAPALYGNHRVCCCSRCGQEVVIGRTVVDVEDNGEPRHYRKAFCSNCGLFPVPIADSHIKTGDRIMVNKTAFWGRAPRRWEVVVFQILGKFFVKRVLGLPGEEILIHEGDLYVDGRLVRKSLADARIMRVLVFDQEHAPRSGWKDRWESNALAPLRATGAGASAGETKSLALAGLQSPHTLTYRHFSLDTGKCDAIRDEYAYNAGLHADSECVHDFMMETEIEATAGRGSVALRLCDGHDWIEVLLPIGASGRAEAFAWPIDRPEQTCKLAEAEPHAALRVGQRYRVALAFVDRRVTLAVEGQVWLNADLPEVKNRPGVERPFQAQADGVRASLHRFRLYRDVHYGQQGNNGVRGKSVLLRANQYFMLGDNSPNSEDSRFWADDGRVDAASFVGSVLFVNGSRTARLGGN